MPNFDARSFLITFLFVGTICSVVFFSLRRGFPKDIGGIGDWAWGCLSVVLGTALIIGRDFLSAFIGVIVANCLVTGGIMLMITGTRRFVGLPAHYLRFGIALALFFFVLLPIVLDAADLRMRLVFITSFNTALFLLGASCLLRIGQKSFPEWLTAFMFGFTALTSATRAFMGLTGYGIPVRGYDGSLVQQIYLGTFAVALISASLGFLLMATRKLQQRLEHAASRDNLTGAYNRAAFCELFSRELSRSARHAEPLSVLLIDIDDFKKVNDRHGHAMGDKVLQAFSGLATQELRDADVFCRYGGEEFAVLLPRTSTEEALVVAERIRENFADLVLPGIIAATISVGLMSSRDGHGQMAELIEMADRALYLAKRGGKNRVVLAAEIHAANDAMRVETRAL